MNAETLVKAILARVSLGRVGEWRDHFRKVNLKDRTPSLDVLPGELDPDAIARAEDVVQIQENALNALDAFNATVMRVFDLLTLEMTARVLALRRMQALFEKQIRADIVAIKAQVVADADAFKRVMEDKLAALTEDLYGLRDASGKLVTRSYTIPHPIFGFPIRITVPVKPGALLDMEGRVATYLDAALWKFSGDHTAYNQTRFGALEQLARSASIF
ncbi:hypothetical protein [Deinococcus kurensis]|uniref:hypothetical protein n=1 Tax=Deinococcus kurensis TaxID=2662757 RepID=UPI0012D2C1FD|nr:hypothetical protein [Deinococcus kurensis]